MSMERYKSPEGEIGELIMVEETQMFKDYCLFNTNETTVVLTCGLLNLYPPRQFHLLLQWNSDAIYVPILGHFLHLSQ